MLDKEILDILKEFRAEFKTLNNKLDENTQILRALEHKAEINKAEHDKILNDMAHMEGHLKGIDENIDALKEVIGRHEVDITVLKRRPV